jgi:hypothetical protein
MTQEQLVCSIEQQLENLMALDDDLAYQYECDLYYDHNEDEELVPIVELFTPELLSELEKVVYDLDSVSNTTKTTTRQTVTGRKYEKEIANLLNEYTSHEFESQTNIGKKRNGGKHYIDILLNGLILLSLKFQQVQGTAEEKVPFEIMKLQHAIDDYGYKCAILVLAGPDSAWKWRDYYLGEEFQTNMKKVYPDVRIISNKQFIEEFISNE